MHDNYYYTLEVIINWEISMNPCCCLWHMYAWLRWWWTCFLLPHSFRTHRKVGNPIKSRISDIGKSCVVMSERNGKLWVWSKAAMRVGTSFFFGRRLVTRFVVLVRLVSKKVLINCFYFTGVYLGPRLGWRRRDHSKRCWTARQLVKSSVLSTKASIHHAKLSLSGQ